MTTGFHIAAESDTHYIEADCEAEYSIDPEERHKSDRYYITRYSWSDVVVTSKATGESEFWGEEMPNDLVTLTKEKAEDEFYGQL